MNWNNVLEFWSDYLVCTGSMLGIAAFFIDGLLLRLGLTLRDVLAVEFHKNRYRLVRVDKEKDGDDCDGVA